MTQIDWLKMPRQPEQKVVLSCIWCGEQMPSGPDIGADIERVKAHAMQCTGHPMHDIIQQRDELLSALNEVLPLADAYDGSEAPECVMAHAVIAKVEGAAHG